MAADDPGSQGQRRLRLGHDRGDSSCSGRKDLPFDTGIWNQEQTTAWREIVDFIHAQGAAAGIQLAHAGGKAATAPSLPAYRETSGTLPPAAGGWQTVGASPVPVAEGLDAPQELSAEELNTLVEQWRQAAERAVLAGFDVIQIHAAHGYLLHEFLSPLTNHRTDEYGGSLENRARLLYEVIQAVREVIPESLPLSVRFSGSDWHEDGLDIADVIHVAQELPGLGVDMVDVSSGGIGAYHGPTGPGYQVPIAAELKAAVPQLFISAVGEITEAQQAEEILHSVDAVSIGRAALRSPKWATLAALELGVPRAQAPIAAIDWRGYR